PDPAEIDGFVRALPDFGDQRKAVEAFEERIVHRFADAFREGEKIARRQPRITEEHNLMFEPQSTDGGDPVVIERRKGWVTRNLGAQHPQSANCQSAPYHCWGSLAKARDSFLRNDRRRNGSQTRRIRLYLEFLDALVGDPGRAAGYDGRP